MYQHILVPTDGSELSHRAVDHAVALAKAVGAKITGLSVVQGSHEPAGTGVSIVGDDVQVKAAETFLAYIVDAATQAGVPFDCYYVKGESVSVEVVRAADRTGCDLICMGTHGRNTLGKLVMGSQTAAVLHECKIPVVVIR